MKNKKMILLFSCLIGLTVACEKSPDSIPGNTGSPASEPDAALTQDHTTTDLLSGDLVATRCIHPKDFVSGVNNPFFPLVVGQTNHYKTTIIDGSDTVIEFNDFMVTNQTKVIQG